MIGWLERNKGVSLIFFILIAIEIFVISSLPGGGISTGISLAWVYHFSVFFLFAFFFLTLLIGNGKLTGKKIFFVLIISVIYAILDEVHQLFVPLRSAALSDVLTDSAGIFASSLVYLRYVSKKRKDKKK